MSRQERFVLSIDRDPDGAIERICVSVEHGDDVHELALNGDRAGLVASALHEVTRQAGIKGRQWSGTKPVDLDQTTGAQAWLLLATAKPLRRADRLEEVSDGVAAMSREEASYWYAKAQRPRGLRAVRLLLSDDSRRR